MPSDDRFPARIYFDETTDLPVEGGGELRVRPGALDLAWSASIVDRGPDASQFLVVESRLNDAKGRVWVCTEHVSAYDIYDQVFLGEPSAHGESLVRFRERPLGPDEASRDVREAVKGLRLFEDGRDVRYVGIAKRNGHKMSGIEVPDAYVFRIHEKYWAASIDLHVGVARSNREGVIPMVSCFASVTMESDAQSIVMLREGKPFASDRVDLLSLNPIVGTFDMGRLLLRDRWARIPEDGEVVWMRRRLDRLPVFRPTEEIGGPNERIRHEP